MLVGLLILSTGGFATQPSADALYRWTDNEGRVHFGDRPPPADFHDLEDLGMPSFAPPAQPPDQDPYSIMNQLGRLQQNRQEIERERRERAWREREYYLRQRELEARERAAESAESGGVSGFLWPVYPRVPGHWPGRPGRPGYRPPHRPGLWPQPDNPVYRPPHQPPAGMPRAPGASISIRR